MSSNDDGVPDLSHRSAADVLHDHLRLRAAAELEEDLRRNYAADVMVLTARGVLHGHEGVRESAGLLYEVGEGHEYQYHLSLAEDRMAMLEWSSVGHERRIVDGIDSFLIEDGKIKAQTIRYTVQSRELSVSWDAMTPASKAA
jgi:hypothetical protein